MIFDHGYRSLDGVTRARFKALLNDDPFCRACFTPQQPATGLWVNPRTGAVVPMCSDHVTEYTEEQGETS